MIAGRSPESLLGSVTSCGRGTSLLLRLLRWWLRGGLRLRARDLEVGLSCKRATRLRDVRLVPVSFSLPGPAVAFGDRSELGFTNVPCPLVPRGIVLQHRSHCARCSA